MEVEIIILGLQDRIFLKIRDKCQILRVLNSVVQNCLQNFSDNLNLALENMYIFFEVTFTRTRSTQ